MGLPESHRQQLAGIVGQGQVGEGTPPAISPGSAEEVAAVLAYANRERVRVGPDFRLSLRRLNRILEYNAADLTAGVEAGVTLACLDEALRQQKQWLPLGAARPERTTVGGALATNASGPFRLSYGTARDMVIGVRFATAEGKLVKSGGKVVKNVAGYDVAKLIIGSRGTLAIITSVNFKVFPRPAASETMALGFASLLQALAARTAIQKSFLTPLAMDLFDQTAARTISPQELPPGAWVLAVAYGGVEKVIERYRRELGAISQAEGAQSSATLPGDQHERLWDAVRDLPAHMEEHAPRALRLKVTSTISQIGASIEAVKVDAVVSRAGTGVTYFYREAPDPAAFVEAARSALAPLDARAVVEYSPAPLTPEARWGPPGDDFAVMQKLKQAFDPNGILNPGSFVGGI